MKTLSNFLMEATESRAVMQAQRLGFKSDGHGGWYDKNGEFVAKTVKGELKFFNQRQKEGEQDPKQVRTQNNQQPVATQASSSRQDARTAAVGDSSESEDTEDFGTFPNGEPRRMPAPTNADGSPKEDRGKVTVVFGRFNPPTIGHQKLLDAARKASGDGDLRIYPSRSNDPKKNPLDPDSKIDVMRQMYPDHAAHIINDPNSKTIFDVLKTAHQDGYSGVNIVVGGDRLKEFEKLSGSYNGKIYDFGELDVVSAGERDPDAEGIEGMSASKMRKAAVDNDFKAFRSGVPKSIDDKSAKLIFNKLKKSMNLVNSSFDLWQIAPKFDWINLRENYVSNQIFKVGDIVENLNTGLIGEIIRRGTNYLICVTEDNVMFKSWIKDVMEKVVNYSGPSGVPANQREIGTDSNREYAMKLTGTKYIKNFISKYKKK
jgi:hypothetical protein|tara:strand:- start:5608 stop:6897 length:1290 start_codon:yes stop_codon:yes gene_type:complete